MVQTRKKPKDIKHLIFSNFTNNRNCDEDCPRKGACSCDEVALDDERHNLNRQLDGRIIAIASVGTWNGRRSGYKLLGNNIQDILYSETPLVQWYSDGRNIKGKLSHHDGTNYITYRVVREDKNIEKLMQKLYNGDEVTAQTINYYTKSLHPYVASMYGW
jgi:hypothetical protein